MNNLDIGRLPSPCWLLDESKLLENVKQLDSIRVRSGAKILLALKGYALWKSFPLIRPYLDGCCTSGLHESILAHETFKKEVHCYSPAFSEKDIGEISKISQHLVFNTPAQFKRFSTQARQINPNISLGLRVNPEYSVAPKEIYNPCGLHSRLGTKLEHMPLEPLEYCEGLHFHALCEQDSDALEKVLQSFEENFSHQIKQMKWLNFGGGHHITRKGYDVEKLIKLIKYFKNKYAVEVYLEPGEAIGWETGVLVSTVLDIVHNGMDIAILDSSAEAHMPDSIIMPYRVNVRNSGEVNEKQHSYKLTGNTCLAGDVMGDYSFDEPLQIGDKIIFEDQMHYTMVKATTFNGIGLPSIAVKKLDGSIEILRNFNYEDFKERLS